MKNNLTGAALLLLSSSIVHAGGIERTTQSVAPLFEDGNYVEFNFATVSPEVSGTQTFTGGGIVGSNSGDMSNGYSTFGLAFKSDINENLSYALIYDQPYGADVTYPSGTGYFAGGSSATFDSNALTAILQYNLPSRVSVYGGLRYQTIEAQARLPFVTSTSGPLAGTPYSVSGERDGQIGYLAGVSYEKPDIALRVALTYQSSIEHELDTTENSVLGLNASSVTEIETPQSLTLDFQTGIAQDTLLFGSVRWVEWTEFQINPSVFSNLSTNPLVSFADNRTTFTLGLGRRLNENWSIAGSLSYEETTGSLTGNLGPTDGFTAVGLAATYTQDKVKITTGIRYTDIGNATTRVGAGTGGVFADNDALALGVRIGYNF